ncbi:Uncharacterised protein [Listeria fleischmannii subsp. fleischmannii]|uniref:Uncharacterized protein n=1 Tax=Listeria fleischmannii subsp. fleischmannii TaxID=1671902 RepID=A0A2X3GQ71_9LIST|nr:Uncharacterised protein [Listeria fleischmannii subsp. fleischmannii]
MTNAFNPRDGVGAGKMNTTGKKGTTKRVEFRAFLNMSTTLIWKKQTGTGTSILPVLELGLDALRAGTVFLS